MAPPPAVCPVCGGPTEIRQNADVRVLYCTNPDCQAKQIKKYALFVSRDALNIEGMSEATIEKFIQEGLIHSFPDLFRLERYRDRIVEMEGFGEKSYEKLTAAARTARSTTLARLVYGLGIAGIGAANARVLSRAFGNDPERLRHASREELMDVGGIGAVLADGIVAYFAEEENQKILSELLEILELEPPEEIAEKPSFAGKTFVITGTLETFANRKEAQAKIESVGGKVTGSVTSKTDYLINNDIHSGSSKNRKARELGIPILSEEEFLRMLED